MTSVVVTIALIAIALVLEDIWARFAHREFFTKGRSLSEIAWAERLRFRAIMLLLVGMACSWAAGELVHSIAVSYTHLTLPTTPYV